MYIYIYIYMYICIFVCLYKNQNKLKTNSISICLKTFLRLCLSKKCKNYI